LSEEYLFEQQRKLQQQKQQAGVSGNDETGMNAAKIETAQSGDDTASGVNTDTSDLNQSTQTSRVSVKATSANAAAASSRGTNGDTVSNQALISKANSGAELNASELQTLKQVDPVLYARVVKAQKAREEVRIQLSENPSNAVQIAQDAISKNTSGDEDTKNLINRALLNEYKNFASRYDQVIISGR
jgi:hypothetical protein